MKEGLSKNMYPPHIGFPNNIFIHDVVGIPKEVMHSIKSWKFPQSI